MTPNWKEFRFNFPGFEEIFIAHPGYIQHLSAFKDGHELSLMHSHDNVFHIFFGLTQNKERTPAGVLHYKGDPKPLVVEGFDPLAIRAIALELVKKLLPEEVT